MEKQPLVSIIVPVYNAALHLPRCIESITQQTYKNLEILLINDGSTDQSPQICQEYAQKDSRIKVIHQKNQGVSVARNAGLDHMRGDFFAFLDADDWYFPDAVEALVSLAQKTQAEITWGQLVFYPENKLPFTEPNFPFPCNPLHLSLEDVLSSRSLNCWDKLYAQRLKKDLRFNTKLAFGEDSDFLFRALQLANFTAFTAHPVYAYVLHMQSVTHKPNISRYINFVTVWETVLTFCIQKNFKRATPAIQNRFLATQSVLLMTILLYDIQNQYKVQFSTTLQVLRGHIKDLFACSLMGRGGKLFMLFPLTFPWLAKLIFRLPGICSILRKQYIRRLDPHAC